MKNPAIITLACESCHRSQSFSLSFTGWLRPSDTPGWVYIFNDAWLCTPCMNTYTNEREALEARLAPALEELQRQIEEIATVIADLEAQHLPTVQGWLTNQESCMVVGPVPCGLFVGGFDTPPPPEDLPCEAVFGKAILFDLCKAPGESIAYLSLPFNGEMPAFPLVSCVGSS